MIKVVFIRLKNEEFELYQLQGLVYPPLWALTLDAHLKSEFSELMQTTLIDLRLQDFEDIPSSDYFLLSGLNQDLSALKELTTKIKSKYPTSKILLGGPITWSFQMEKRLQDLNFADHIFIGPGEIEIISYFSNCFEGRENPKIIECTTKFSLSESIPFDITLINSIQNRYSGGCVEVSRGCPYMCEFCDIRVMPDNNRANNKNIDAILSDLKSFHIAGMKFVFIACDNFNGNVKWAEELCDAIIEWRREENVRISFYTWCTISINYHPNLLQKMRYAGFDTLFIGIESFHKNSLIETIKIQNVKIDLQDAVKNIQSYGFIIYAGLIIGFDSEPENISDILLDGIENSGLISGDISPLIALPGTPLFNKMLSSGRIRKHYKSSLGYKRYSSNIIFNRDTNLFKNQLFKYFKRYNSGKFQRIRLINFLRTLKSDKFIHIKNHDYASVGEVLNILVRDPGVLKSYFKRLYLLFKNPERIFNLIFVTGYILYFNIFVFNCNQYVKFWLFAWTTSLLKNDSVRSDEIDIEGYSKEEYYNSLVLLRGASE